MDAMNADRLLGTLFWARLMALGRAEAAAIEAAVTAKTATAAHAALRNEVEAWFGIMLEVGAGTAWAVVDGDDVVVRFKSNRVEFRIEGGAALARGQVGPDDAHVREGRGQDE
jgi:hypothetical protein